MYNKNLAGSLLLERCALLFLMFENFIKELILTAYF